jgi:Flp pilus assembly CpaF family ATPase
MTALAVTNERPEKSAVASGTATHSRLEELAFLVQSGRLRHWQRGVTETLARAGFDGGLTAHEWAETPWYGPLDAWLKDGSMVSDILINGPGRDITLIEQGQRLGSGVTLHLEWVSFVQRQLMLRSGLVAPEQVADLSAMAWPAHALIGTADGRLRFAITRPPASPAGPTLSLRVLPRRWRTLDDFVLEGIMPRQAAALLIEALRRGVTILVAGGTGSGKTTLTAALLQSIGEEKRVVCIEEARELPDLPDSVAMEVLRSGLTFSNCVRFALRQKPDLIVVGEVRGPEALAMLQAAATGHPGIGTIHAPDVQAALKNLERMACERSVPATIVRGMLTSSAMPLIVAHIGRYGGKRVVGQIEEVTMMGAGGAIGDKYTTNPLFVFNPTTNQVQKAYPVQGEWGRGTF